MFCDPLGLKEMSSADKKAIKSYQDQYNTAKSNNDYVGMNKAHVGAVNINKKYDPNYKDNYDYTHGGKIYNYRYSYEEFYVTKPDGSGEIKTVTGNVYILNLDGSPEEQEAIADSQSIGYNDVVVLDYRDNKSNPNMQIRNSINVRNEKEMYAIIDVLLGYEEKHPSNWNRTRESLYSERIWHNRINIMANTSDKVGYTDGWVERTRHVDLDNQGEQLFPANKLPDFSYYY